MAPGTEETPFGIRVLKVFCLLTCLLAFADLVSSISGIHPPPYLTRNVIPENDIQRLISDVIGLSYGPLFYAVQRRLRAAWKLGWAILIATSSSALVEGLATVLKTVRPESGRWIALTAVTTMTCVVAAYWLHWWNRQKKYLDR